jgi:hypothetical protein
MRVKGAWAGHYCRYLNPTSEARYGRRSCASDKRGERSGSIVIVASEVFCAKYPGNLAN